MKSLIIGYSATLLAFVCADMVWLGIMVPRLYRPSLEGLLAADVNLPAAAVFYLIFPVGLLIFAVTPAAREGSLWTALASGALFGFFTYATYDLTNQATLRGWATLVSVVDMGWGTILGAIGATAGYFAVHYSGSAT